jgi:NAD-dependent deacetylase
MIDKLQELINKSDNIVFFGGAGVSTESGIKDFRGKNGLYKENNYHGLPPEYMLSHTCLELEPELFFKYYRENMNASFAKPNITHKYLKKLEDKGKLKAIVTQNIDGLHQLAGSKNVLEVHGTTKKNYCNRCNKEYDSDYIFNSKGIPKCDCGGIIRPRVTLYEESLPNDFIKAIEYISKADLLIVAGTSLTVEPASSLVKYFMGSNLVIINNDPTPYDRYANLLINKPLKDVFSKLK